MTEKTVEPEVVEEENQNSIPDLDLVIWPDERLKYPVMMFGPNQIGTPLLQQAADAMIKAMYKYQGIGLAAPQVGIPQAIFVIDAFWHKPDTAKNPKVFINPQVVMIGDEAIELATPGEGCLSFPYNYRSPVPRSSEIRIKWVDLQGIEQEEWFEGMEAIVIQHEFDHLIGKCFYDRLSKLKRDIAFRKAKKIRRQYKNGMKKAIASMKNAPKTVTYALKVAKDFEGRRNENNVS